MTAFKTNLDIQQHQLLNAVLHNKPGIPANPVEGQMYYDTMKQLAYLWDGGHWVPWGSVSSSTKQVNQFLVNIPNPRKMTGFLIGRVFRDQIVVRIDSHISNGERIRFNVQYRNLVNDEGIRVTDEPIDAVYAGTETTVFPNPLIAAGDWLHLFIQEAGEDTETLTVTITCITV
jgi:hypothetical protein